jgi:hypothetical protein
MMKLVDKIKSELESSGKVMFLFNVAAILIETERIYGACLR